MIAILMAAAVAGSPGDTIEYDVTKARNRQMVERAFAEMEACVLSTVRVRLTVGETSKAKIIQTTVDNCSRFANLPWMPSHEKIVAAIREDAAAAIEREVAANR